MCDALKMAALTHVLPLQRVQGMVSLVTPEQLANCASFASAVDTPNNDGKWTRAKRGTRCTCVWEERVGEEEGEEVREKKVRAGEEDMTPQLTA